MVLFAGAVAAQEERPQITPGERKATRKKEAGPRALAVLQLASDGKASLLPVTVLVNGKFYDATAYKANPIPMALESGTVYEGEHTGNSLGLFTVSGALHSIAVNAQSPWIGTGVWLPSGKEAANKPLKAETVPVGIDTSDAPPRLSKSAAPESGSGGTSGSSQGGSSQPGSGQPAPSSSPKAPSDTKPADSKPTDAKAGDRPKGPASDSGADESNRPRLRRGKPTEPLPEDEIPGYRKPGAAPPANPGKIVETAAAKGPIQMIPAISDANGPEPRLFTFQWLKSEEGERRQQMMALAQEQLRAYLEAQTKAQIMPKPAGAKASKAAARKAPDPILENAQMIAYDLWVNNQPVLVFAADAHLPPPAAGSAHAATDSGLQYTIMLVARTDIYNNLHTLYVGITDKYHLDITPRLELIDAVDADGDGRGELLFRETSDVGSGWVIYRASADKLWKLFDSLNPE